MTEQVKKNGAKAAEAALATAIKPEEQSALRKTIAKQPNLESQNNIAKPQASKSGGDVTGPIGRIFNRILGVQENRSDTANLAFNKQQLRAYLDGRLQLAEGEFFRGAKLDGVADKLMQMLDSDSNGLVTWGEFQTFRMEVLGQLAPGIAPGASEADTRKAAGAQFASLDKQAGGKPGRDGKLGMAELAAGVKGKLPKDTDHADLVAQLGARIALDAGDTDQRGEPVKKRELTLEEWVQAAAQLAFQP
jgi:hypothetical protein